ncbi:multiple epidermal growth factor-like domains protein 6 isoform X2 [Ixodes scapularis]|uniref:multiple epidermal growth factor-like domains protein 6 isoform X2 n=1 Tax=Ixodes scapularis TaxID=6945 RepID=UPI001A9F732E|nr:multiple epidermal growth factor-like domains protein 6 isoform X2 [Ixodes scapularis]
MTTSGMMIVLALAVAFTEGAEVTFVRCPNGALCPDRTTCCLQNSGQYGCCPYQFAVCCSDHLHCCPEGYHCNMSNGTCLQISTTTKKVETLLTPMVLSQQLGPNAPAVEDVRCPDRSFCRDGETCCMFGGGFYDCCPYPHAVCCSDHASCCPEGYRCEVSTRSCVAGNSTLPMLKKIDTIRESSLKEPTPGESIRCPDGNFCQDGQTCCLLSGGRYGCCPYPHAVCCSDHASCCPEGYRCKVSTRSCVAGNSTLPMLKKIDTIGGSPLKEPVPVERVRCPDGNYCQDGQTCCLTTVGRFGCCPYPHAECCSDYASCCPEGYRCKVSTRSCVAGNSTLPMLKKIDTIGGSPLKEPVPVERVRCPDGNYCQDGQTCCLTTGGRFGCCPYPHAECCSDHASCCPEGYRCQLSTHSCILGNSTVAMLKKISTFSDSPASGNTVSCPDGSSCLDQQTCCQSKNGTYGCCPLPEAVCCPDHETCCPKGTVCVEAIQACLGLNEMSPMLKKVPAFRTDKKPRLVSDVQCPDGGSCPDGQTCCQLQGGSYGCCPYENATCCSDDVHCCPSGYECDTATASCLKGDIFAAALRKLPARRPLSPAVNDARRESIRCPDGNFCQDGQTCCLLSGGRYGCCPYPHAVCCSDHESCCPEGYRCKVSTRSCVAGNSTLPMLKKIATIGGSPLKEPAPVERVRCPDGNYCQDGQTCCLTTGGRFGCCPYPHAECCSDHASCCPEGYRCQLSTHSCILGNSTVAMLKKISTFSDSPASGNTVSCPDGSSCLDQQTCCQFKNGTYGCCPLPEAVCCPDHKTCCPKGKVCVEALHACLGLNEMSPMLKKVPAFRTDKKPRLVSDVQCPDGGSCPDGQTCCQLQGGSYGCCPYENATCCSDDVHCCPSGYECDTATASCHKGDIFAAALRKLPARRPLSPAVNDARLSDVQCPDGGSCPDGQTCCQLQGGSYGCCPYEDATCCSDDVHCCPSGYECDTATASCRKGDILAAALRKLPARRPLSPIVNDATPTNQKCPDGAQCDDDQTCCELTDHSYGCCPYNHAVCCPDLVHCCPEGYTCDTTEMTCVQSTNRSSIPLTRLSLRSSLNSVEVQVRDTTCKDGHICPGDTTCCPTPSGRYNCCPFASGVCCSDGEHCCPQGFQCDLSTQRCVRGALYPFLEKVPMHPKFPSAANLP